MPLQKCICDETYTSLQELRKHLDNNKCKIYESLSNGYECVLCEKDLLGTLSLFLHLKKIHQELIDILKSEKMPMEQTKNTLENDDDIQILDFVPKPKIIETIEIESTYLLDTNATTPDPEEMSDHEQDQNVQETNESENMEQNKENSKSLIIKKKLDRPARKVLKKSNSDYKRYGKKPTTVCLMCKRSFSVCVIKMHMKKCKLEHPHLNEEGKHSDERSMDVSDEKTPNRTKKDKNNKTCPICKSKFSPFGFYNHKIACEKYFGHINTLSENNFECIICKVKFENISLIRKHLKETHFIVFKKFEASCSECKSKFYNKSNYQRHLKRCANYHHLYPNFDEKKKCPLCDFILPSRKSLYFHLRNHDRKNVKFQNFKNNQQTMPIKTEPAKNKIKTELLCLDANAITKVEICPFCEKRYLNVTNHLATEHQLSSEAIKSLTIKKIDVENLA